MEHKNFIICDSEEAYAVRLMEWLMERQELYVQVRVFTSVREAGEFAKQFPVAVLLIEEIFPQAERDTIPAENVFVMVREGKSRLSEREHLLLKYRPARILLEQILEICLEKEDGVAFRRIRKDNRKLIGIYSPAPLMNQTVMAVQMGKELAEQESVLYLNLQEYAGWSAVTEQKQEYSLEDLIYYVRQGDEHMGIRTGVMAGQLQQLSYLEPMKMSSDLKAVTWQEWSFLLTQILEDSIFETVIVEAGESMQGLWELLEWCGEIYVWTGTDVISEAKFTQFEENLKLLGKEAILQRIKRKERENISGG